MKTVPAAGLIGVVLLLPAAGNIAGWLLRDPRIIDLVPGAVMVFNTALCFGLVALALVGDAAAARRRMLHSLLGGALVLVAALVLSQHLAGIDLGIDLAGLHRWHVDVNPYPGRMSPITACGFLLCGLVLFLMHRVRGLRSGLLVQALGGLVMVIGGIGVAGYLLKLHLVYRDYLFGQMALLTALGLILCGVGLWLCWRGDAWYAERRLIERSEQRIALNGAIVLAIIVSCSVLAGFVVMQRHVEALARDSQLQLLKSRIDLFRLDIDLRTTRAALVATRPNLIEQLGKLHDNALDGPALLRLQSAAASFLPYGISGLAFADPAGEPWLNTGQFADAAAFRVSLATRVPATLIWDSGYVLRVQMPMERDGKTVGIATIEQRLPVLTGAIAASDDFSDTGEIAVCARRDAQLVCFPQHLVPKPFTVPYAAALPMAHALNGEVGVLFGRDYRRQNVIAAHGPIGALGLGLVVKMDTAELYAPLRENMYRVFLLMLAMLAAGVWLLYLNVAPLAARLARSEQRLQFALEGSRISLWDWNTRTGRVYLDERWEQMLGGELRASVAAIAELRALVHPEDVPGLAEHLRLVLKGAAPNYDVEHRVRARDGGWIWIRSRGKVTARNRDGLALRLIGTNIDITRRKEAELLAAHQATHDALTGLPNRSLFQDRLRQAVARARRSGSLMAVMYLDVDKFKGINDTLGHEAGDTLLKGFAGRLIQTIRTTDTAARLGGDEFAVVLESLGGREDGCRIAEKIVVAMRPPFPSDKGDLSISTSAGIAFYAGDAEVNAEALIARADEALYRAKAAGRDNYQVAA